MRSLEHKNSIVIKGHQLAATVVATEAVVTIPGNVPGHKGCIGLAVTGDTIDELGFEAVLRVTVIADLRPPLVIVLVVFETQ